MKKIVLVIIGLIIFSSCKKEEQNNSIIVSGKVLNPVSDSLNLENRFGYNLHTFYLTKDNTFNDTINITEGLYYLSGNNTFTSIYLKPNYNLNLSFSSKEPTKSFKYLGIGANENNYLIKNKKLNNKISGLQNYTYQSELSEKDFLRLNDSLYKLKKRLFDKHKQNFEADFSFIESNNLKYEKLDVIYKFEKLKRFVTGDDNFKVSIDYPNTIDELDLTNGLLSKAQYYIYFLMHYVRNKTDENWNEKDSIDYDVAIMKTIGTHIKNIEIKEAIAHHMAIIGLDYTTELDSVFNIANSYISNDIYLDELRNKYRTLKPLLKGSDSPTFEFYDIENNLVSLSDLKGKIVYVDIWATWCSFCVKEIPFLNKLEKEFKDKEIQFVSICKNDKKEYWMKMVNEKKTGGIQLFAPDNNNSFFKEYVVQAVPRFILIDKYGKIIDINAKRPSDPELRKLLEKLTE